MSSTAAPGKRYTAAVIGLGKIGLGFDYDCPDDGRVLTHASGFEFHQGFELIGAADPDPEARRRFSHKYRKPAYASLSELYQAHRPEVVSIGVPTSLHRSVFDEVLSHGPQAILAEKPLATTLEDATQMVEAAQRAHCLLLVNYFRRFLPASHQLKHLIDSGQAGEIYKGLLWYSKGILNNGSHFIDLLRLLLGEVSDIKVLRPGRACPQISGGPSSPDGEPDVLVRFGHADVYCLAGREETFSVKQFELLGTRGKICYLNGGEAISFFPTRPHPVFDGYTILSDEPAIIKGDLYKYQHHATEALFQALNAGQPLASNGRTALETMRVIETIQRQRNEVNS